MRASTSEQRIPQRAITRWFIIHVLGIRSGYFVLSMDELQEPWAQRTAFILSMFNQVTGWMFVVLGTLGVLSPYLLIKLGHTNLWLVMTVVVSAVAIPTGLAWARNVITRDILYDFDWKVEWK